ncbi:MAG: T9SS type A sorting domain-containing protein [Chitinophagaceae bacterium]|nr:T9SS type A sorting domain-containing protein [Chitinophagaceae bacterium]
MKKALLFLLMITSGFAALAQFPTTVTTATNCSVFRNFNTGDEGFSSASIYSDNNDAAFNWNAVAGAEIEGSGLTNRSASLISPSYILSLNGQVTVGFRYVAPSNTEFRIRIISGAGSPPLEILANTANGPVYTPLAGNSGSICLLLTDADLIIGRQVRFEFTFRATQPGNILFDDFALTGGTGGPLPVVFEGFVARKNGDETVKLLWDVGTEINVKGYYVESSTNGVNFTNAGYVVASSKRTYSFDYAAKLKQTTFFRVRNIDYDGKSKYTPVIKVYATDQTDAGIQIYPVPATDQVTIQHRKASDKTLITLVSTDGKVLQQVKALPNSLQTQLNLNYLKKGLYFVKYDDGKAEVQVSRIIKN